MNSKFQMTVEWCSKLNRSNIADFHRDTWRDPRDDSGFRLTTSGYNTLLALGIDSWKIPITETKMDIGRTVVGLNKIMTAPYYIHNNIITVFSSELAAQLILYDGNLSAFIGPLDTHKK